MQYFLIQKEVSFPLRLFSDMDCKYLVERLTIEFPPIMGLKESTKGRISN